MPFQPIAQVFFESGNWPGYGWSEIYYPFGVTYDSALTAISPVISARVAILPGDCIYTYLRISDVNVRGDAYVVPRHIAGTWESGGSLFPDVALMIRQEATPLYRSNRYLRTVPSDQITDGVLTITPAYNTLLTAYYTEIIANTQHARRTSPVPPKLTESNITACVLRGIHSRKTGRPFGLPRGRRLIA